MANRQYFSPASAPLVALSHGNGSSKKPILGGILIAIILVFVAGWLCFCFKRKLYANLRLYRKQKGKLDAKKMKLRRFRLEELQKATENFSQEFLIGRGSFANVYRGTFPVEGTLAIKKPHSEAYTSIEDFRNEVRLLSKVKHDNLVALVGFCEESGPKEAKILVYEYVTNGSLLDYIIGRGGRSLTWRERVKIAIGAAKGIGHLHEGISPSIIHRDLKPSNILVGEGFEAKVSDFGLVRTGPDGDESHVTSKVKGTLGYLDPAYCTSFHLSPFTDVYSFGVILLQLLTARPALDSARATNSTSHIIDWARLSIEKGKIMDILDTNLLVQGCNMEMMLKMGEIGLRCVVKVPKERPTMTQVRQELEAALEAAEEASPDHPPRDDPAVSTGGDGWESGMTHRSSHSVVSVDGIGLERFHVDMDSVSFQSVNLRCLETSISMD
ncbi:probable serine/threonine-protein kinase PBL28 isoform X1 [Salvia hispanica]|uniref:probable serine/threonine-protein kinase PBL28 isoform X1 n=1 Tax=Salvia hispanica TaxID=49212 RepID=UPI002008FBD9|nr:probable serine/threonine-protein kinase PBL28 isoform X1 [Salvia hispanica]